MSNANWACFDCREVVRRPSQLAEAVPCPRCRLPCRCLGTRLRIPSKVDGRAWHALRAGYQEQRLASVSRVERLRVRRFHRLERRIEELEARPTIEGRDATLRRLREELASLRADRGGVVPR
ncbi:hypothetical protein [Tautonia plasticadhaerens]|uniref:Uncharacterized protein n=1 Tax=Tautonia plasticadhaerens TaxID=2527974 RepID=A0A518HD92_9BACT|nr:hypothetical protein [Tautonia plasticadhaerens]QDV38835.1 hypothetical protein ElP_67930 [Tautonia plasticadhaerens]